MEKIKPFVTLKIDFEYGDISVFKELSKVQNEIKLHRMFRYVWEVFDRDLGGQKEPAVTEKHQFECRTESKVIALFRVLLTVRIQTKGSKPKIFPMGTFLQVRGLHWYLDEWMEPCISGGKWSSTSRNFNTTCAFGVSSMWEFLNDMFQQIHFSEQKLLFFWSRRDWDNEKTWTPEIWKKVQLLTFLFRIFNRFMTFEFFSAFYENRKYFLNFLQKRFKKKLFVSGTSQDG